MNALMTKSTELATRMQITAETGAVKLAQRYAVRKDRGQTAVEYLGIVAVVALIVLAIAGTDIGKTIFQAIQEQVSKVTSNG